LLINGKLKTAAADYVLAAKSNQSNLLEDLREYFDWALDIGRG